MEAKQIYNTLLLRAIRAEIYLDNSETPRNQVEKYIPEFLKIMKQLNELLAQIGDYTQDELLNGFQT